MTDRVGECAKCGAAILFDHPYTWCSKCGEPLSSDTSSKLSISSTGGLSIGPVVTDVKVEDIEVHAGDITRRHRIIGPIKARVVAATLFSKTPTIEDVNLKLREEAIKKGANAVIGVRYDRGVSATSWKALTATGVAVFLESDEVRCPFCAELIRREAIKCKHCGTDVRPA